MKRNFKPIKCNFCNKIFIPITSKNKTCSKECLKKYNYNKLKYKKCVVCNKKFKHKTRLTCSEKCYFKYASDRAKEVNILRDNYIKNGQKRKDKTYEEYYGKEKAEKIKLKASVTRKKMWKEGKIKLNSGNWKKNQSPWNKNLKTNIEPPTKNKTFDEYYGIEKSKKIRNQISETISKLYSEGKCVKKNNNLRYKNVFMRSSWEVKVAKYLDDNNIKWEYETKNCIHKLSNGKNYIVDFYLPDENVYIEVKGWWDKYSKQKCEELIKQKGIDKLYIVDKHNINDISLDKLFVEYTSDFINGVDMQVERLRMGE